MFRQHRYLDMHACDEYRVQLFRLTVRSSILFIKVPQCDAALFLVFDRYHGPKPMPGANRVWVSNHTSMIDYVVLCSYSPFAVIMQLHTGWIAFLQTKILSSLGCLWFNRCVVRCFLFFSNCSPHVSPLVLALASSLQPTL